MERTPAVRMKNGWTGGQYSLFRALLGSCLLTHYLGVLLDFWIGVLSNGLTARSQVPSLLSHVPNLLDWSPGAEAMVAMILSAALASICLGLGWMDRPAALWLGYAGLCLVGRGHSPVGLMDPMLIALPLVHALSPRGPYGALEARGRPDPGGGWRLPGPLFLLVWVLLALGHGQDGYSRLAGALWFEESVGIAAATPRAGKPEPTQTSPSPVTLGVAVLQLSFGPLALMAMCRPGIWLALLVTQLGIVLLAGPGDGGSGMLLLHLIAFDPDWMRAGPEQGRGTVFYDGGCGLCHRSVRFILAEDSLGRYRFSPLEDETLARRISPEAREGLPDSVVLLEPDGGLHVRSEAAIRVLLGLGGLWRILGLTARVIPAPCRDWAYDRIAAVRYRIVATPPAACPIVPPSLRARFDHPHTPSTG